MLAYLAGAIEYSPDSGKGWRKEITPFLIEELGHTVYDPAEDERKSLTEEEQKCLRAWKLTDFGRFQVAVRKIIEWDLEIVARSDYVICYLDEYAMMGGGTSAELTIAYRRDIPVYMVSPLALAHISGWILGCCAQVFGTFEELRDYLRIHHRNSSPSCSGGR